MSKSEIDIVSRKVVLFQSEILESKKKISEFLKEKTFLEKETTSLRENLAEVRQENTDLQEIVYDLNKENNQLKNSLEQMTVSASPKEPINETSSDTQAENEVLPEQESQSLDPLEQKRRETGLEKQLFEYERKSTIPDYIRFEADENNYDSGDPE